jgi:hypothetical protein
MATYWGHLYKSQKRKTQGTHTISQNIFTYLLIILPKSLTKASEELWLAPHRCFPTTVTIFLFSGLPSEKASVGRPC